LAYIQKNPGEVDQLFNTILIGTTAFFRDTQAFEEVEQHIRKLISFKKKGDAIRLWIAGCATGEEAYSFAIMLFEILKERIHDYQVQIFATDIDNEAINFARRGIYHQASLDGVKREIVENFFIQRNDNHFELLKSIRNMVLFSKHDLTNNPPFLRLDFISCRNVLIYFGAALQKQVFPIFHYALAQRSYLFLGKSESIGQFTDLFETIDSKHKIFQKKIGNTLHAIRFNSFKPTRPGLQEDTNYNLKEFSLEDAIKNTLYQHADYPFVVVNDQIDIIEIQGDMRPFLTFPQGKTHLNLLKLVHESLQIRLRNLFNKAVHDKASVTLPIQKFTLFEKEYYLRLKIKSVYQSLENLYLIFFESYDLEKDFIQNLPTSLDEHESPRMLELEHELAAVKEHLQTYIEEIETSNEELQALNEELQSANEELQSSNEELETSNEELQSSNEELQIAYGELKSTNETLEHKERYISEMNADFEALLSNTKQGFILLEKNYSVRLYNPKADEIIQKFSSHGLQRKASLIDYLSVEYVANFIVDFKKALEGKNIDNEVEIQAIDGHKYWLNLIYNPVSIKQEVVAVAMSIIDVTEVKNAQIEIFEQKEFFKSIVHSDSAYLIRTDMEGRYTFVNDSFCKKFALDRSDLIGKDYKPTVHPDDYHICEQAALACLQDPGNSPTFRIRKPNPNGGYFDTEWQFTAILNHKGQIVEVQGIGFDITEYQNLIKKLEQEKYISEVVLKSGQLGTWFWEVQTGKVTFNEEWVKILGYDIAEIQNFEQWKSLIHPQDLGKVLEALQNVISGKIEYYEVEHRKFTKKGQWKWLLLAGKIFDKNADGSVNQVIGIHKDISERKEIEEQNRIIEERTQSIFKTMQEGIVIQDMQGSIISCNEAAEKILGLTYDQMIGKTSVDPSWRSVYEDGTDFPGQDHPAMMSIRTGKPQTNVIMGVHKPDNTFTWLSVNSQLLCNPDTKEPYAAFTTFYEITDIRRAEQLLSEEKRRLASILQGTNVGTWEWNVQTGEVIFNERWANIIGYDLAELEPIDINTWLKFAHPEDLSKSGEALDLHFRGERDYYDIEVRMLHKDGHWVWVWDRGKVFSWTDDGKPLWMSGTHQEITEKKLQEVERMQIMNIMRNQNQRLKEYTYIISHNLRSSVANILALSDLMMSDTDATQNYLPLIQSAVHQLDLTIMRLNELLNIEKEGTVERSAVKLLNVIESTCELLRTQLEGVVLEVEVTPDIEVEVVPAYLESIVHNLLTNAIKYKKNDEKAIVKISVEQDNDFVILIVKDHGIGIDMTKYGHKLFKMNSRLYMKVEGKGMGLFLTKHQVEAMGGKIAVESKLGEGTTFRVWFPRPLYLPK
jgi:two-component system CheB/CheR fusion protein